MFQKWITKINKLMLLWLCLTVSLLALADRTQAQPGILADSLVYPEYRYYDEPVEPDLYLIRPGEVLSVTFVGSSLKAIGLKVGPEGLIVDQNLGRFDLTDKTLTEARSLLLEPLKQLYNSEMIHITINNPYRVAITVSGAVNEPGTYLGFTSQRVSEIIEQAGGVADYGSTRRIVFEGGPHDLTVDLDRAILAADNQTNPPLYAGLSIFVPRSSGVKINLMGDRPRSIELLKSDNLESITYLAGGRGNNDDQLLVLAEGWQVATETDLVDQAVLQLTKPESDDRLIVFGGVNRPGRYEFSSGITLSSLIAQAGGLNDQADRDRIAIFRRLPEDEWGNESKLRIPIVSRAGHSDSDNLLAPGDSIFVPVAIGFVHVVGQVRVPGYYPYQSGLTIKGYVKIAGGFTNQADTKNLALRNRVTGASMQVAPDAVPGDGDQVRVEKRETALEGK